MAEEQHSFTRTLAYSYHFDFNYACEGTPRISSVMKTCLYKRVATYIISQQENGGA